MADDSQTGISKAHLCPQLKLTYPTTTQYLSLDVSQAPQLSTFKTMNSSPCPTDHPTVLAEAANGNSILPGAQSENSSINFHSHSQFSKKFCASCLQKIPMI